MESERSTLATLRANWGCLLEAAGESTTLHYPMPTHYLVLGEYTLEERKRAKITECDEMREPRKEKRSSLGGGYPGLGQ